MDDLNQQISSILNDPQAMEKVRAMAASLGLTPPEEPAPPAAAPPPGANTGDISGLLGLLGAASKPQEPPSGGLSADSLALLARAAPLLRQINQEDDATRLLSALRPLLGDERRKKLDEAVKLLRVMRLLPLLRESGLLGSNPLF